MHFATKKQGCCTKQKLRTTTLPDSTNPHELVCAALYVVQHHDKPEAFNSAGFNAARSIICGATPSLAALVPRGARGRFGKSSIFCAVFPLWGGIFTEKSRRQSASSLVRRGVAPKWKIATVECGFAASPSHFPLFCTMDVSYQKIRDLAISFHRFLLFFTSPSPPVHLAEPNDFERVDRGRR